MSQVCLGHAVRILGRAKIAKDVVEYGVREMVVVCDWVINDSFALHEENGTSGNNCDANDAE